MSCAILFQVDILNHCFDDIEAFAQKLKHVHDAQKELEARKLKKKSKQKQGWCRLILSYYLYQLIRMGTFGIV